jgi:hypothetical protein
MVHIHAFQVGTTGLWSGVLGQVNRLVAVHLALFLAVQGLRAYLFSIKLPSLGHVTF